ncbi:MAG: hypothetical protein IJ097_02445 [Bacilli bacterium]|nr:hypothetical protein [Bacilli bacterium]
MNFVNIENKGKQIFAKFPKTRRFLKGVYHRTSYILSKDKIKSEGNITRISPDDEYEYFYGYYDKSPWDITDRYMIALQVKNAHKVPDSIEEAKVVVFDTQNENKMEIIGTTHCWNTQQGCMAQWLAPDFKSKIIYNDFRNNKYVSVVYNFISRKEEKVYDMPIYDISKDGKFALTLDFSRLHRLRKGYGYANLSEETRKDLCPDKTCIWKIDLKTGKISDVIKYTDLANFETRNEMSGAEHKVNHIMISPNGKRFMVLHRWFKHNEKFTRLVTMNIDGTDMYNLSDDNFVSHCCWKNDKEILSFLRKKETKDHYYLMRDKTKQYKMFWEELNTDGHCTYSPNGKYVITDTYPNRKRIANVYICEENKHSKRIASVFAPFRYDNDVRCDLHPRWDHKNEKVCIDSVHEGKKELYIIKLEVKKPKEKMKIPKIIHSVWVGNGKKSPLAEKCIESWNKYLCDYKIIEWNEENFNLDQAPKYVKEAIKAKKWAFVSDYIRLKVLYEYGGIYMDTDMELYDNLDQFLYEDGFFCIESMYTISTAIIAAKPKSKWIKELLEEYDKLNFINDDGSYNTLPNTKRVYSYLTKKYNYKYSNSIKFYKDGLVVYPSEYFSPLNCFTGVLKKTNNTIGMHHYDNTWKSKKEKLKRKILQIITRFIGEKNRHKLANSKQ